MGDAAGKDRASAKMASGIGKDRVQEDATIPSFWLPLLRSAAKEVGLGKESHKDLAEYTQKSLDEQFSADFDEDDALDDRIASESRGLKRDIRRTQKKQALLNEEHERLESFRPSRKVHEQDEASEIAERLHPLARQYLSKKVNAKRLMSPQALQDLARAKRELESLEEGLLPYEPEEDEFLVKLLKRLNAGSKSKKVRK
ncbi:hypothetical protein P389DRAFT_193966 [Cystobasidium minutum MCA 4210]|uniref:uncharacterized protein n=1 Tax=Cystobasidium minutum MCA 4210 TaxID=1397322 RepID=UPI0034CFA9BD|eukprot:jgi/Rhomi1/193966/gm1.2180_g